MSHGELPRADAGGGRNRRTGRLILRGPVDARLLTPTGAAFWATSPAESTRCPRSNSGRRATARAATISIPIRTSSGYWSETELGQGELAKDDIAVLETNLDDATPEVLAGFQRPRDAGARDVSILPATMKSCPGHLVKVICKARDRERVARALAEETERSASRTRRHHRWIANREFETVTLEIDGDEYEVTVKS